MKHLLAIFSLKHLGTPSDPFNLKPSCSHNSVFIFYAWPKSMKRGAMCAKFMLTGLTRPHTKKENQYYKEFKSLYLLSASSASFSAIYPQTSSTTVTVWTDVVPLTRVSFCQILNHLKYLGPRRMTLSQQSSLLINNQNPFHLTVRSLYAQKLPHFMHACLSSGGHVP